MQNIGIPSLVKQKPGPVANGWLNAFTSQSDQVAIRGQTVEIWAKRKNLPNTFLRRPKNGKHLYFFRTKGRIKHNLYDIFIWIMALALSIFNLFDIFPPVDRLNSVWDLLKGRNVWMGRQMMPELRRTIAIFDFFNAAHSANSQYVCLQCTHVERWLHCQAFWYGGVAKSNFSLVTASMSFCQLQENFHPLKFGFHCLL